MASFATPYKTFSQQKTESPSTLGGNGLINIVDFGAKADDATDNTKAIQSAIDAAVKTGVLISPGTYLTSTLKLYPQIDY